MQRERERVNKAFITKLKKIRKCFQQRQQFLQENFIDLNPFYLNKMIIILVLSAASLKQKDRWLFIIIQESTGDIEFASCLCPAGRAGICSHLFAVSKVVAKWVTDRVSITPQE